MLVVVSEFRLEIYRPLCNLRGLPLAVAKLLSHGELVPHFVTLCLVLVIDGQSTCVARVYGHFEWRAPIESHRLTAPSID